MIDGSEPIYPTTDSNYINNSDDEPTVGLWGGLTLKRHMVIEFVKAIYANPAMTSPTIEERYTTVREAILLTREVIKQLNEDESK